MHLDERSMTLLVRAIAAVELHEAEPLLKLDRIARHRIFPSTITNQQIARVCGGSEEISG
jgi:hypothetical protein